MAIAVSDIDAALVAARTAWPNVNVTAARLVAFVPTNDATHLVDLVLTCACTDRDAVALRLFDVELTATCERAVRQVGGDRSMASEVAQRLRERILVGDEAGPRLSEYTGRGPLRAWLRVVATREALGLRRRDKFEAPLDDAALAKLHAPDSDPELAYLHSSYRGAFRTAFAAAFAALSPLERDLVRRHHVGGESIDTLGVHHDVHRATAARWVARARERLLTGTRDRMAHALAINDHELDSILRLVRSHLDVSLRSQVST